MSSNDYLKKVKNKIPRSIKPAIKYLYYLLFDTLDLLTLRNVKGLPPKRLNYEGNNGFKEEGEKYFKYFVELVDVKKNSNILEIGCGFGRMAMPFTKYLSNEGSYVGVDIINGGIKWCSKNITQKYPNFYFSWLKDIFNTSYNPKGKIKASEFKFLFPNDTFDFVILISVFTHMLPEDIENYISEITRILKPNSKCFATFYLINPQSEKLVKQRKTQYLFLETEEGYYTTNPNSPEDAVAYKENFILDVINRNNLKLSSEIKYGHWRKDNGEPSLQDIIVFEKLV